MVQPRDLPLDVADQQRAVGRLLLQALDQSVAVRDRLPRLLDRGAPFVIDLFELIDALTAHARVRFEPADGLAAACSSAASSFARATLACGLRLQRANRLLLLGGAGLELQDACVARNEPRQVLAAFIAGGLQRSVGALQLPAQHRHFRLELLQAAALRGQRRFELRITVLRRDRCGFVLRGTRGRRFQGRLRPPSRWSAAVLLAGQTLQLAALLRRRAGQLRRVWFERHECVRCAPSACH